MTRAVATLPLDAIAPDTSQPRKRFREDSLRDLAASLDQLGLLQPITVRARGEGYVLVAGERRWRAARLAGWSTIEAIVDDPPDDELLARQLLENVCREDMDPLDLGAAYQRLVEAGQEPSAIEDLVGAPRGSVKLHLTLLKLEPPIQTAVRAGMRLTDARMISRLSPESQQVAWRRYSDDMPQLELRVLCDALEAKDAGHDMFPELDPLSPGAQRAQRTLEDGLRSAGRALTRVDDLEAADLVAALAANPYGLQSAVRELRRAVNRTEHLVSEAVARLHAQG